ncbi:hypothetical protein B7P43_G08817 [Cryptotermes secundus]|uniref:Uncharacterized protein n=1 Tax=Cryptotermes secundus TaxID=105785 RepID=A0A2J7RJF9_9NEOP|nr:hypothetical protein B7P43_G08817 [Cryptotermes secundus]
MKMNPDKSKAESTRARVKARLTYYFGDQLIPEVNTFEYLRIIIRSDPRWADHVNYAVQRRAAKFADPTDESVWETLTQRRLIARLCALYKAYTRRPAWRAIGNSLLKPCYLSRGDRSWKVRSRKHRTDVGKYSFVNRTIKDWKAAP